MRNLVQLAAEVQRFMLCHRWKFCFIGGLIEQELAILADLKGEPEIMERIARLRQQRYRR